MEEKISAHQIREMLAENIDGISKVHMSNIGLEVFPRLMEMLSMKSDCHECKAYFDDLLVYAKDIRLIFKGTKEEHKRFETLTDEAMSHLKKSHGTIPRGQTRSFYMFLASIIGLLMGWLIFSTALSMADPFRASLLGWTIMIFPGWFVGNRKEKKLAKDGKTY